MKRAALAVIAGAPLTLVFVSGIARANEPAGLAKGPALPVFWTCETHAVVVAPEAASSKGMFKLRTTATSGDGGTWTLLERAPSHTGSFTARHGDCEKGECAYSAAVNATRLELWAPRKVAPASLPKGEPLTVATLDLTTGKLRASSFIDNAIAALEQGTCKAAE